MVRRHCAGKYIRGFLSIPIEIGKFHLLLPALFGETVGCIRNRHPHAFRSISVFQDRRSTGTIRKRVSTEGQTLHRAAVVGNFSPDCRFMKNSYQLVFIIPAMVPFVTRSNKTIDTPGLPKRSRNKPQARTKATQARILDAAQALFSEQGFEHTQLDQVAARAGYSRGAIYAHYPSKENLFLELIEKRVHTKFAVLCQNIEAEHDVSRRSAIFRRWVVSQVGDPSWGTLTLEFKLYAVRRPELRERLLKLYEALFKRTTKDFGELLFGKELTKAARRAVDRRLAVFAGALSGIILESHFRPALLPSNHLQPLIEELFEALIHT